MPNKADPVLTDDDYRLLADFRRSLRGFFAFSKTAVAKVGLAPQQYQALLVVRARCDSDVNIGDLADELYVRHHTAVELVDRLVAADLIRREASGSGRTVILKLTSHAEAVLASLAEMHLAELHKHAPAIRKMLSGRGSK